MRGRRFLVFFLFCVPISGCATFRITEDFWFHPGFAVLSSDELRAAERVLPGNPQLSALQFSAPDGTPLYGLHLRTDDARPTVLYFGGDSFRVAEQGIDVLRNFALMNLNAVMVDYRGYGGSGGSPDLGQIQSDALAAYHYLRDNMHVDAIVLHGFSMGSFVASGIVDEVQPVALVLEATATNVTEWADAQIPWYAGPFVSLEIDETLLEQDNRRRLQAYHNPLLLIAGAMDRTTPPFMARDLYRSAATSDACKQLAVSDVAGHGETMQDVAIRKAYLAFLGDCASPGNMAELGR